MQKCDACGKVIQFKDLERGAVLAVPDQPETDNLCIECNKDVENDPKLPKR